MKSLAVTSAVLGVSFVLAGEFAPADSTRQSQAPPAFHTSVEASTPPANVDSNEIVKSTCVRCHSDARLRGNLSLETFDVSRVSDDPEIVERMIRKVRAGMMPPPGVRAPAGDTMQAFVEQLERVMDDAWKDDPNPGRRTFQRLNRPEYKQAIRNLLALEINAGDWLPLDQMSANFDNIADVQALSPLLLKAYLNAAADISRLAVGDRNAPSINVTYTNSQYQSQHPWDRVEGAPYGTRGGMVVDHVFPADGMYRIGMAFASGNNTRFEDIDISIDGERVALMAYTRSGEAADGRGGGALWTEPFFMRAGGLPRKFVGQILPGRFSPSHAR